MGVAESGFEKNIVTTTVDSVVNWARKSSLWPMTFGQSDDFPGDRDLIARGWSGCGEVDSSLQAILGEAESL